jgi:hypothetical protein
MVVLSFSAGILMILLEEFIYKKYFGFKKYIVQIKGRPSL